MKVKAWTFFIFPVVQYLSVLHKYCNELQGNLIIINNLHCQIC